MKNIKNISLLRQQMSPTRPTPPQQIPNNQQQQIMNLKTDIEIHEPKIEIELDEEMPTDLSMVQNTPQVQVQPTDLSLSIKNTIQDIAYHSLKLERQNDDKK